MGREAFIEIEYPEGSKDVLFVLDKLRAAGWVPFNRVGKIEYLPLHDKEMYEWRCDEISEEEFRDILCHQIECNENFGVAFYYEGTDQGVVIHGIKPKSILFSIDINRKTLLGKREALTDFVWYFNKIIKVLYDEEVPFSYNFHDTID